MTPHLSAVADWVGKSLRPSSATVAATASEHGVIGGGEGGSIALRVAPHKP